MRRPIVASLHGPHALSGVSVWSARMAAWGREADGLPFAWRTLIAGVAPKVDASLDAFPGAEHATLVRWRPDASPLEQVLLVRDALRTLRADVVVPNYLPHGFAAAALDHPRGLRCAAICHGDDAGYEDLFARCAPLIDARRAVSDAAARRCGDRSRWDLSWVARRSAAGSAATVPPSIPCGLHIPDSPLPFAPETDPPRELRLLWVGRLDNAFKRAMDVARLADELLALRTPFSITVAGDGPARSALRAAAAAHIDAHRLTMLGALPHGRVMSLFPSCDLLVMTSASEGFPIAAMEAMACGRPIAVTRGCGGASAIIARPPSAANGLLVDIGDMPTMARELAALARDRPRLTEMGRTAHQTARRHFDLRILAPRYTDWLREARARPAATDADALIARWRALLAALELIGPFDAAATAPLARAWLQDHGAEGLDLPRNPPKLPSPAERRLRAAVERLVAAGHARIALYGAGLHTRRLAAAIRSIPQIVAILDDRAGGPDPPDQIADLPLVHPDRAAALGLDALIISSDEHEAALLARIQRSAWADRLPAMPLYSEPAACSP